MIIGTIAAMTIPSLNQNIKEKEFKTGAKKAYATLNGAAERATTELGYTPKCFYPTDGGYVLSGCTVLKEAFLKNLNIVKTCKNQAYAGGCIPAYKGSDTVYSTENPNASDSDKENAIQGKQGLQENNIRNLNAAYNLADGMIVFPYGGAYYPLLAVDVNGKRGPNKWGYDIYLYMLKSDDGTALFYQPWDLIIEKGGKSLAQILIN